MSEYNIDAYNQVGPMVQMELVEYLAGLGSAEVDSIRPIAITVWTEAIRHHGRKVEGGFSGPKYRGSACF